MSSPGWLHDPRFAPAPRRGRRHPKGRDRLRAATHRLNLEVLEDRVTPSFSPATGFPVGPNPQAVVAADFNHDGHLDLATANAGGNTVSVLLGDDRGGFGAANHFATDAGPRSMAVGDFNNDGHLDLVTANAPNSWASILLGNGDGSFRAPTTLFPWGGPWAVAVGDFNADGRMDIAVNEYDMEAFDDVQVLLGNGRGGFTAANAYTLFNIDPAHAAPGLAVGDLNGDGKLDAAVVVEGVGYAALGNGDGTFGPGNVGGQEFITGPDSRAVAVGDFTRDGTPDLVVAGQTVNVLRGHGDGWFDDPISHSANGNLHTGVMVADFNGDGKLDAVTADADTGTVSELLGNGNGTLTYAGAYAVGSSPTAVAVGDFNGDGRPDVAVANAGSNTVAVLLNNGTGPPPPPSLQIGDAAVTEGNTGTALAVFTVTLSAPSTQPVTVQYDTANGTATAGSDYQAGSGTLTIPAGQTTGTIAVRVLGDRLGEPDEAFVVNLSGATNATIVDAQAVGTIVDNEPRISIDDVSQKEGNGKKSTLFIFTVRLSVAYDQPVTMSFQTANGTATTSDGDYVGRSGTLTFAPGETTKTIAIEVEGDNRRELNEYFYLDVSGNSSNSLLTKKRGVGTILNDD